MSWVSANVSLYLKEKPKDYLGITHENWNFGKDKPTSLAGIIILFVKVLADFYIQTHPDMSIEQFNTQFQEAGMYVSSIKIVEESNK